MGEQETAAEPGRSRPVSTAEAAELANVSVGTVRSWASRGKLVALGTVNGVRYYAAAEVLRVEAATRRRPRLRRLAGAVTSRLQ